MTRTLAAPIARRIAPRSAPGGWRAPRPLAAARLLHVGRAYVSRRRRLRVALLALLVALPLACGGWLWFRQSSLVSVEHVRIGGVHGPQARAIDAALERAARGMSTLDVSPAGLLGAVSSFRVVREVRAYPSFPHGLRIEAIEQLPVAVLSLAGQRTAVAADGVVLGPALVSSSLPSLSAGAEPAAGGRVRSRALLAALTVLGAAPAPLERLVERVYNGTKGLTLAMRGGLLVYFGDATRPHAKWLSLARVLADSSSAGASYVDVRLPARPAAGFPAGVLPPASSETVGSGEQAAGSESPVAALAAGLTSGSGGATAPSAGSTAPASSGGAAAETAASPSQAAPAPASQAAPAPAPETTSAPETEAAPSGGTTGG